MVFDACASFEGETLKTRILVSNSGSLTQTMQPLAHRTKKNNKIFQNESIQKEIQDQFIATFFQNKK